MASDGDPWAGKPAEAVIELLAEERYTTVVVDDDGGDAAAAAVAAAAPPVAVVLEGDDALVALAGAPAAAVVSVEASSVSALPAGATLPHLRRLTLSDCAVDDLAALKDFAPRLLCLDACFLDEDQVSSWHVAHPTLRQLVVDESEGVDDTTLPTLVQDVPSLTTLSAAESAVSSLDTLTALAPRLPALTSLDVSGAPVASSRGFAAAVAAAFPRIKVVNKMSVKTSGAVTGVSDAAAELRGDVGPTEERSSCSCLFGNACMDPYACKDWEHRHDIAAAARKSKLSLPPELRK